MQFVKKSPPTSDVLVTGMKNLKTVDGNDGETAIDALQRASRHAQASIEVGRMTARQLQLQGERMGEIGHALDGMERELGASDRALQRMTWRGRVKSWFASAPRRELGDGGASALVGPLTSSCELRREEVGEKPRPKKTNAVVGDDHSRGLSEEEDKLLDSLMGDVHVMRRQGILQGAMLSNQIQLLDKMAAQTDEVTNHMSRTQRKVEKML